MFKTRRQILCCALLPLLGGVSFCSAQQPADKTAAPLLRPMQPEERSAQIPDESLIRAQLELHPNSAELLYQLALAQRIKGEYRESLQTYTHAASLQKPNAMQLRSVALDYVQLNSYDEAIRWLRVAAGMEPRNVEVLYSLGRCLYTQNIFAESESAFRRVLEVNPTHLKAQENLGLVYDAENQPGKAEAALRTAATWATERNSQDYWPFLDLGSFLLDQSRAPEALPFLTRAAALDSKCAACHEKLGRALSAVKDAAGAVRELEVAVQLDPENAKAHFELGRAYREAGNAEKARAEFDLSKGLYGSHNQN
jgi:tetratricopeptide (TPR) repeat protein